jgi:hypothetical protein
MQQLRPCRQQDTRRNAEFRLKTLPQSAATVLLRLSYCSADTKATANKPLRLLGALLGGGTALPRQSTGTGCEVASVWMTQ